MKSNTLLKVGLTGGMGCGKSSVRQLLAQWFPTVDADTLAKEIAATDPEAVEAIKQTFGREVYDDEGHLRRKVLAGKVFGRPQALEKLNRILHPRVIAQTDERIARWRRQGEAIVIVEAALFYEVGWDRAMDRMVVVTAPLERRIAWLMQRDGLRREEIEARLLHQLPVEEKAKRADYVIHNDGSLENLKKKVEALREWLLKQIDP